MKKIIVCFMYKDCCYFVTDHGEVYRIAISYEGYPTISQVDRLG